MNNSVPHYCQRHLLLQLLFMGTASRPFGISLHPISILILALVYFTEGQVVDANHLAAIRFSGYCSPTNTETVTWASPFSIKFETDGKNVDQTAKGIKVEWTCAKLGVTDRPFTSSGGTYNGAWSRTDVRRWAKCPCHDGYTVDGGYNYFSHTSTLFSLLGVSLNVAESTKPKEIILRLTVTRAKADGQCAMSETVYGRILLSYPLSAHRGHSH